MTATVGEGAQRIVVRCPNWLGDVVMSTPGLRRLRRRRPDAHVTALLPAALAPLLEGAGLVDEIRPLASRGGGWRGWRRDVLDLRAGGFDLGLAIPESVSSALMLRAAGVRPVVGFARDPLRRVLLDRVVPAPPAWGRRRLVSRERFVLALVDAIAPGAATDAASAGAPAVPTPEDLALSLAVTPDERRRLAAALGRAGVDPAAWSSVPPVVVAPGAGYGESKLWPAESYAALVDRLAAQGLETIVVGTAAEAPRVEAVVRGARSAPPSLAGALDVGALKALVAGARALVANDAGTRHLAAAFGVPSVVFFGPTAVEKTADNLARVEVLERDHACRPCYRRRCPIDHRCLRTIDVEAAVGAMGRALGRRADGEVRGEVSGAGNGVGGAGAVAS